MSAAAKRWYWIRAPRGVTVHRAHTKIEGNRTVCGKVLRLGWHWFRVLSRKERAVANRNLCTRCFS